MGALRLAVGREEFGGPNDVMTYAALVRHNGWDVTYCRTPALSEDDAPGVSHHGDGRVLVSLDALRPDVIEPAELCYPWTAALCQVHPRVFPLVWQNLPMVDRTPHTSGIMACAAGFIARSSMACELLRLYGVGHDRIHLCHASVDTERFRPPIGESFRRDPERVTIGFAARPVLEKGISDLVYAMQALPPELQRRARLLVAGGGLASQIPADGEDHFLTADLVVRVLPGLAYRQMPEFYWQCDVFVLPSWPTPGWLEQWGIAVTEAMACSLPVVTTDVGAFREILPPEQHSQWMIPARDWDGLRDRLAVLIEQDSLRATLGAQNRERVCRLFDGRETAAQYRRAFGEIT